MRSGFRPDSTFPRRNTKTHDHAWKDPQTVYNKHRDGPAFAYVENDPELPNVLLYGDSILIGYTPEVRNQLDGTANVYRIHKNGLHSGAAIPWLKDLHTAMCDPLLDAPWTFDWDLIHFNVGLHDLTYRIPKDINDLWGLTKPNHEQ